MASPNTVGDWELVNKIDLALLSKPTYIDIEFAEDYHYEFYLNNFMLGDFDLTGLTNSTSYFLAFILFNDSSEIAYNYCKIFKTNTFTSFKNRDSTSKLTTQNSSIVNPSPTYYSRYPTDSQKLTSVTRGDSEIFDTGIYYANTVYPIRFNAPYSSKGVPILFTGVEVTYARARTSTDANYSNIVEEGYVHIIKSHDQPTLAGESFPKTRRVKKMRLQSIVGFRYYSGGKYRYGSQIAQFGSEGQIAIWRRKI